MNPHHLSASDLLVWGIVAHLIADWPLQNEWMASKKQWPFLYWAAWVHAGIHMVLLSFIFGWVAVPLAIVHLIIDTRYPVVWWSEWIKQTQPKGLIVRCVYDPQQDEAGVAPMYDVGLEVRFWTDQVFHIMCIAVAALLVS